MHSSNLKLLMISLIVEGFHATDLYTLTAAQTFTVGQPHGNVIASPGNFPDTAFVDPNSCSSIGPHGGSGNFFNYQNVFYPYYLSF